LPNITVLRGTAGKAFVSNMTPEQLEETKRIQDANLRKPSIPSMPAAAIC
jgi:glutamyl/glutaminyl-tRNA synthetase